MEGDGRRAVLLLKSVQKLIAKYGLAAHLALLAVAPLLLFPFFPDTTVATVLVWLAIPAWGWLMQEPSVRNGEAPHDARERVVRSVLRDPVFWLSLVLIVFTGLRALNTGIGMSYDAETAKWRVSSAIMPVYPGVIGSSGYLPFAAAFALSVILQGTRHALGKSARMSFLLVSSALAGLGAVIAIVAVHMGDDRAVAAAKCLSSAYSFVGMAFGVLLLGGLVALIAAFERRWDFAMLAAPLSVGGTAAGAFVFSPPLLIFAVAAVALLMLVYAFAYACRTLRSAGEFKYLVALGISLTLGFLLVVAVLPGEILQSRLGPLLSLKPLDDGFAEIRLALSDVAVKTWLSNLWAGAGIGSFPLSFRFNASEADWALVRGTVVAVPNGWWQVLAERGVSGLLFLLLPAGFLLFTYLRRAWEGLRVGEFPHPACLLGLLVPALLFATGALDCSLWRADVLIAAASLTAVSANSFLRLTRTRNG